MNELIKSVLPPIGWATVGSVITWFILHRLDLDRGRTLKHEADIKAGQLEIIPVIDRLAEKACHYPAPNIVRMESVRDLKDLYLRFRIHLCGRHLRAVNKAWQNLEQTTEAEMVGSSKNGVFTDDNADDFKKVANLLISRLQAFRDSIYDT